MVGGAAHVEPAEETGTVVEQARPGPLRRDRSASEHPVGISVVDYPVLTAAASWAS